MNRTNFLRVNENALNSPINTLLYHKLKIKFNINTKNI